MREGYVDRRNSFWAERDRRRAEGMSVEHRRRAKVVGFGGFLLAAALPIALWHDVVAGIASEFRLEWHYLLSEWSPWALIVGGLAFFAPVAWSAGTDPESRWYPRARNAYAGWAVTLYLLGMGLAAQVAQIYELHAR